MSVIILKWSREENGGGTELQSDGGVQAYDRTITATLVAGGRTKLLAPTGH